MAADDLETKDRLLEAALINVPFDGWSVRTLDRAAEDAGIERGEARLLFPGGADGLNEHLDDWADRQMLSRLEAMSVDEMRVRDRVIAAVRARLEVLSPHKEAVRRGLPGRLMPQNALVAPRSVWRTVDRIWEAAGDRAADWNRYTKRGLLAGVYVATFLYWLDDRSEGNVETWRFLERRIDDVLRTGSMPGRVLGGLNRLNPFARRA